ncbi:MAG: LacI family DNA-binding transcriptional regulator [Bacillus sp. (in: firmicutes)]
MDVTIKDVAKEANVATSTVSRVLKDSPHISEKTKKRVREVMDRLGYYPNFQAQSLAGRNTKALGVIMPNSAYHSFQNPFFSDVLRGISIKANEAKYGLYLSTSSTEEDIYDEVVSMVQGKRVDGVLLLYSRKNDKLFSFLEERKVPYAVVGRPYKKEQRITYVDNDNVGTAEDVTNYLLERGHTRIGFIGGNLDYVVTIDRLNGYKQALKEAGIPYDAELVAQEDQVKANGKALIERLMYMPDRPTALITLDDLMAYEIINYLEELQINVPEDLSIISFNNHIIAEHSRPALTSVDINIFQLGYQATACLIEKISNPDTPPKRITIETKIIERKSCCDKKRILA